MQVITTANSTFEYDPAGKQIRRVETNPPPGLVSQWPVDEGEWLPVEIVAGPRGEGPEVGEILWIQYAAEDENEFNFIMTSTVQSVDEADDFGATDPYEGVRHVEGQPEAQTVAPIGIESEEVL